MRFIKMINCFEFNEGYNSYNIPLSGEPLAGDEPLTWFSVIGYDTNYMHDEEKEVEISFWEWLKIKVKYYFDFSGLI